ncbi:WD-40 repeat-containing protein [Rhizobium sp. PP-F2F-G36]|nr:WD-40 repeat-containing protein [Rhizobium sp. PP-F2F-G36]
MPTVAPLDLEAHIVGVAYLGDIPVFADAAGLVHRLDGGHAVTPAHEGLLVALRDDATDTLLTGGEDGRVLRITRDGGVTELAHQPRKWISKIAAGPQGAVAFATGKTATVRLSDGTTRDFTEERTVEGIAFAPKGLRIALARYNGVSLHWVATSSLAIDLDWKGAHTGVTFSPDGRFVVTMMQENALHGWKLDTKPGAEARHMRMSGYPAKVKSWSWSTRGKWLASSGAPAAIVWPFQSKDGPMGKAPLELGTRADVMVSQVACHPSEEVAAIGYSDGMVLAVRFADSKEVLLRRPGKGAVSAFAWSRSGQQLAFGTEAGEAGVIDLTS